MLNEVMKYRVLIIDDNEIYPFNLRRFIEEYGSYSNKFDIDVMITHSAREALVLLESGDFDIVVLDTCLSPPSDKHTTDDLLREKVKFDYYGYSLYKAAKRYCADVKVFAVSKLSIERAKEEYHYQRDIEYFCKHDTSPKQIAQRIINFFETDKRRILNNVFVVYGHNKDMRKTVTDFVRGLQIHVVDLFMDAPTGIKTVFDCLERSSSNAECAIVLLSGDDMCITEDINKGSHHVEYRARQNVIFEMGLFAGLLGKDKVIVLYEASPQFRFPSDIEAIFPIVYDTSENWKENLKDNLIRMGFYQ